MVRVSVSMATGTRGGIGIIPIITPTRTTITMCTTAIVTTAVVTMAIATTAIHTMETVIPAED